MNLRHISSLSVCLGVIVPYIYEVCHAVATMPTSYGLLLAGNDPPLVPKRDRREGGAAAAEYYEGML